MSKPLYSVATYDWEQRRYTPQAGLSVPSFNITFGQLRQAMRELRRMGYECHRNDSSVLVERTDGKPEAEIFRDWNPPSNPTNPMAKKTAVKKAKRTDLPGQKTMPHGPKKVAELEEAGANYTKAEAAVASAQDALKNVEGVLFDLLKKKRLKSYSVAGREFYRKPGGEKLGVRKIKD